jgi:hypothetical protein
LDDIFRFSKILGFGVFLVHPETTLPNGLETSGQRAYRLFWHISRSFRVFAFWMIFSNFQKNRVLGYSWSTLGATIRIGQEMLVSRMRDFF